MIIYKYIVLKLIKNSDLHLFDGYSFKETVTTY